MDIACGPKVVKRDSYTRVSLSILRELFGNIIIPRSWSIRHS